MFQYQREHVATSNMHLMFKLPSFHKAWPLHTTWLLLSVLQLKKKKKNQWLILQKDFPTNCPEGQGGSQHSSGWPPCLPWDSVGPANEAPAQTPFLDMPMCPHVPTEPLKTMSGRTKEPLGKSRRRARGKSTGLSVGCSRSPLHVGSLSWGSCWENPSDAANKWTVVGQWLKEVPPRHFTSFSLELFSFPLFIRENILWIWHNEICSSPPVFFFF